MNVPVSLVRTKEHVLMELMATHVSVLLVILE